MDSSWYIYALGFVAQGLFSARMLVQWILSEQRKRVVSPTIYWILSLAASYIFMVYGWLRNDFAIILGQMISYCIYIWNLGAKGVWNKLNPWLRHTVVSVLLATPAIAAILLVIHTPDVFELLFRNDKIPLWLLIYGSIGQVIFTFRFVYQWLYSRNMGESLLPIGFWILSLIGSLTICSYGLVRHDWVIVLGQSVGLITYTRNLIIGKKEKKRCIYNGAKMK